MGGGRCILSAGTPWLVAGLAMATLSGPAGAQDVPCELVRAAARARLVPEGTDLRRALELLGDERGSWLIRRGSEADWEPPDECGEAADSRGLRILPLAAEVVHNSGYPRPAHDGALWTGRGLSTGMTAGFGYERGPFSAALRPLVGWQQNADFDFVRSTAEPLSPFHYAWHGGIDWPTRFGAESFATLSPGQSFIRVDLEVGAAGVSTENLWWGPALRNPLLMGSAAPGFPHLFVRVKPVDIWIGTLEAELIWGVLRESDYFDRSRENDRQQYAGQILLYRPRVLVWFELGIARSYLARSPETGFGAGDFLLGPFRNLEQNLSENQLASVFGRIAPPGSGFEAWAEWAREDWWSTWDDLLQEPDHTQAYTVGGQQAVPVSAGVFRIFGEVTHLGASTATVRSGRGASTFYTHSTVPQGYTHNGQLLGAPIGPGSDAQALGADLLTPSWNAGLLLERVRYDNDAYYQRWAFLHDFRGHDVELTAQVHGGTRWGGIDLWGGLAYSRRTSRNFLGLEDPRGNFRVEGNWGLRVGAGWRP